MMIMICLYPQHLPSNTIIPNRQVNKSLNPFSKIPTSIEMNTIIFDFAMCRASHCLKPLESEQDLGQGQKQQQADGFSMNPKGS